MTRDEFIAMITRYFPEGTDEIPLIRRGEHAYIAGTIELCSASTPPQGFLDPQEVRFRFLPRFGAPLSVGNDPDARQQCGQCGTPEGYLHKDRCGGEHCGACARQYRACRCPATT